MVYIAASGNSDIFRAQTVKANNLANVNTPGFRADLLAVQSYPVKGPGYASRVYAAPPQGVVDFTPGTKMPTGRALDVAVEGDGWIAVQSADGSEGYTRAGNLKVTQTGQLLTGSGHPVLGNNGPIAIPPAEKVEVGTDGTISIVPVGQEASTLAVVDRIKLVKPPHDQLQKNAQGLLQRKDLGIEPADADVKLAPEMLESSNVDAIGTVVSMIEMARQFELKTKLMKTAEESDAAAAKLINGQ
jgi:flagellar basal-body rod protein FlgF